MPIRVNYEVAMKALQKWGFPFWYTASTWRIPSSNSYIKQLKTSAIAYS